MLDVKKTLAKLLKCDYVIEEGTSGIWTYRKWNSGVAECWGNTPQKSYPLNSAYGSAYYTTDAPLCTFPTGLFTSAPTMNVSRTNGGIGLVSATAYFVSDVRADAYVFNTLSGAQTLSFSIHAIGRWK